ncbi:MAG: hypothetical protein Q7U57_00140 [Methylovulum sp.]|nr:hypothetical protein [Methylovulum sp.]
MNGAAAYVLTKLGNDLAEQTFTLQSSFRHRAGQVGLAHQLIKHWINKTLPRRKDKALKLFHTLKQRIIIQVARLGGKLTPLFRSSKALARGIGRLPHHVNGAHDCHGQSHACHDQGALVAADDQAERSRSSKDLQEAKRVACSFVKPSEPKSILSRKSRLQDQVISVGVYPHLVVHLSFLVILRWVHRLVLAATPALELSSYAHRAVQFWAALKVQGLVFLLPWSVPCRWSVGVGATILSQADPTAHTRNVKGAA